MDCEYPVHNCQSERGAALLPTAAVNLYLVPPMPKIRLRCRFWKRERGHRTVDMDPGGKATSLAAYISTPRVRSINVAQGPRPRCRIQVTFSILSSSPCNVRTKSRRLAGTASDPAETETSASGAKCLQPWGNRRVMMQARLPRLRIARALGEIGRCAAVEPSGCCADSNVVNLRRRWGRLTPVCAKGPTFGQGH